MSEQPPPDERVVSAPDQPARHWDGSGEPRLFQETP